jgi:hypothetical protein
MRTTGKKGTPVFPQLLPRVDQKSPLFHDRKKKPKQEKVRVQDINVFFFCLWEEFTYRVSTNHRKQAGV